ncbi:hypothetical protein TIFTF001_007814 [Ficus carica]|uniref:Uncharacterized protein n=1 Tax=Ficus carica TaxID=3494 RepID=A0AA87ZQX5_FICCA|nr:hypothetical protein TIFTF001_007814 [Ficus carica]
MVRVLAEASPWQENGRCGKEQSRNKIVSSGAWSSHTGEVLQQLGFGNSVSPDNVVRFITEVVSSPSELVVYPSGMSLDGVLVSLELLLCGVSSGHSTTES